jgi:hypothetical protein
MAIQLCTLPWLGFVPDDVAAVPAAAANRIAVQLGVPIADLAGYGARKQTRTEHLRTIAARLGWRSAGRAEWKDLEEFLLARAVEHDAPSVLFRLGCEYLQAAKIVRPGVISLMERMATVRQNAVGEVFGRVEPLLTEQRRTELDGLLVAEDGMTVSRLAWLHRGATSASPMAIRGELDKLRFLRGLDAYRIDLSCLPDARRRRLAGVGRRATNQALARRDETSGSWCCWPRSPSARSRCWTSWCRCSTRPSPARRTGLGASWMNCWLRGRRPRSTSWSCWSRSWWWPPTR